MGNEPTTVNQTVPTKREVSGAVVNPRAIEFPFDKHGFTTVLRKEGVRAIGRIKGDADKFDVLIHTLKVLGEHAKIKKADHVKRMKADAEATAAAHLADEERRLVDAKAHAVKLRNDAVRAGEAADVAEAAVNGE